MPELWYAAFKIKRGVIFGALATVVLIILFAPYR